MFNWFRKGPPPHQTALAMIGARAGDRILVVGDADPGMVAELALVAGLNGEAFVAAPAALHAAFETAAAEAGSLVVLEAWDEGPLPVGGREFDLGVWAGPAGTGDAGTRQRLAGELVAALRPGGRALLVDGGRRGPLSRGADPLTREEAIGLLTGAGAVAARHLATDRRTAYYEARRPR